MAVVLVVLGVLIHSSKPAALRMLGAWFLAASVVELLIAYALPVLVLPALVDSPYAELVAEVDKATLGPAGRRAHHAGRGRGGLPRGRGVAGPARPADTGDVERGGDSIGVRGRATAVAPTAPLARLCEQIRHAVSIPRTEAALACRRGGSSTLQRPWWP